MGDLKGAIIQQRPAANVETSEELFALLPDLRPSSTVFFKSVTKSWQTGKNLEGHYTITNMDHLLSLPKWSWGTIYQAPDIIEHGVKGAIERSTKTEREIVGVEPLNIPQGPPGLSEAVTLQLPM